MARQRGLSKRALAAGAPQARRETFGFLPDGAPVEAVVLDNGRGVVARIICLGASLQSLCAPDRQDQSANIALGYATVEGYLHDRHYVGATVGRYANRIAQGRFSLEGREYQLALNDGTNSLHGGTRGLDKLLWSIVGIKRTARWASVQLACTSADGEMGYPGELRILATYTLDQSNRLTIDYEASTDASTIVNLTHHAYWNLAGEGSGSVLDHHLMIAADTYLPVAENLIPTGEFQPVHRAFDFRVAKPIGQDIRLAGENQLLHGRGYDHTWVIARSPSSRSRFVGRVLEAELGRVLTVRSTQPGLHFYSGNYFDGTSVGTSGRIYRQSEGFALEPQLFPDTPNQPAFGSARLDPGQRYRARIGYEFSTDRLIEP